MDGDYSAMETGGKIIFFVIYIIIKLSYKFLLASTKNKWDKTYDITQNSSISVRY